MNSIWNVSWKKWLESLRCYQKYVLVVAIFLLSFFYNFVVVPKEPPERLESASAQSTEMTVWDMTSLQPEKIFSGVLQGKSGDWYRVGIFLTASRDVRVDVRLHSIFNEDVLIGSFDVAASDAPHYYETVFQIPAGETFPDINFVLQTEHSLETWTYAGVRMSDPLISRLDVQNKTEAGRLAPTLMGGDMLLSGARVEDFGKGKILYSYFLRNGISDFSDLFDIEGHVKFDTKKKIVVGEQKQRTSFTYRFFTVYPFEKFILSARQAGDAEKEVKLEYSFDNVFWREVPATQASNKPQAFSIVLIGTGQQNEVYVRASYNGENKKTGSFGLDQMSVRAELIQK